MLDQYKQMGEQAMNSARAIAEITTKQQDPAPTLTVLNAMSSQAVQQAQLLATLAKSSILGGGGQPGVNWGEILGNAFEMLGNVGAAWAEASATKAKLAAQAQAQALAAQNSARQIPPATLQPIYAPNQRMTQAVPALAPAPQTPLSGLTPTPSAQSVAEVGGKDLAVQNQPQQAQQTPSAQPQEPQPQPSPLAVLVAGVNQAIAKKEPARSVAGKLASIVHVAQEFGLSGSNKPIAGALRALMEDPRKFLRRAYASTDPAYLDEIADILLKEYGEEEPEDKAKQERESEQQVAAETPGPENNTQTPKNGPTEAEMLNAMQQQSNPPVPPQEPAKQETPPQQANRSDVRITVTGPDGNTREVTPSSSGGNGHAKRRRRKVQPENTQTVQPTASDGNGAGGNSG
jgi:hypothetical protein